LVLGRHAESSAPPSEQRHEVPGRGPGCSAAAPARRGDVQRTCPIVSLCPRHCFPGARPAQWNPGILRGFAENFALYPAGTTDSSRLDARPLERPQLLEKQLALGLAENLRGSRSHLPIAICSSAAERSSQEPARAPAPRVRRTPGHPTRTRQLRAPSASWKFCGGTGRELY
jgi:hypothetical protein